MKHDRTLPKCCFELGGQDNYEFSLLMIGSLPLLLMLLTGEYFPF